METTGTTTGLRCPTDFGNEIVLGFPSPGGAIIEESMDSFALFMTDIQSKLLELKSNINAWRAPHY